MKTVAKIAARVAAGVLPAVAVARLGMPALGALVLLAVLILAMVCWVLASQDRTNRVSQILLAGRGIPAPQPAPVVPAMGTGMLRRGVKLVADHARLKGLGRTLPDK
jgi:hypothetical protein